MSKFSLIARIQHWMDSVPGQTFMNYAYSWGAAVVILGTLFKLTHIPGANMMLFIGMGTEVFVFFIAGFDRPFDAHKDTELAEEFVDLEELEALKNAAHAAANVAQVRTEPVIIGGGASFENAETPVDGETQPAVAPATSSTPVASAVGGSGGGTVIIGGGVPAGGTVVIGGGGGSAQDPQSLLTNAQAANAPEVEDAIEAYVDQLRQLTETLGRVKEQADRMSSESAEMENLNRNLTGINTIYEMQLKSVSQQVGTIDQINEQTRRMAKQIEELNGVYARMIEALTVNMPGPRTV